MYERLFAALDPNGDQTTTTFMVKDLQGSAKKGKAAEDMFNDTNMSFGREIEHIQK